MLYYSKPSDKEKIEYFVGFGLMLSMLVPHTNIFFLLVNPLLCVLFKFYIKGNNIQFNAKFFVIFTLIISLLLNFQYVYTNKAYLSFVSIILVFFVFPNVGDVKIRNVFLYVTLVYILFSQIIYMLNIPVLTNLFDTIYPSENLGVEALRRHVSLENYSHYRLGGIYRNPNDCARAVTLLLTIFIVENFEIKLARKVPFILMAVLAIFLTGSRTGLAVGLLVLLFGLFQDRSRNKFVNVFVIILMTFISALLIFVSSSDSRIFDFQSTSSIEMKFGAFSYYLSQTDSIISLLFGNFDIERFMVNTVDVMGNFDADYGFLVFCYGFIGALSVLLFYIVLFKRMKRNNRIVFLMLIWAVSNSVIFSFRMFFPIMLAFSRFYCHSVASCKSEEDRFVYN